MTQLWDHSLDVDNCSIDCSVTVFSMNSFCKPAGPPSPGSYAGPPLVYTEARDYIYSIISI